METQGSTAQLVDALGGNDPDQLFPMDRACEEVECMTATRPHKTAIQRWARAGLQGVRLQTVTAGRKKLTTRRWLLEFFAAVDAARRT